MNIDTVLEAVYTKHFNLFLSIGLKYRFDAKTAEDMIHSAFVKALRNKYKIKAEDEVGVRNYIIVILRNLCLDHLDKTKRAEAVTAAEQNLQNHEAILNTGSNPLHEILITEEMRMRNKAIENINPQRYREPVRMYLDGYNRKEIAEMVGKSPGSTKNLIFRGLKKLKKIMERMDI